MNSWVMNIFIWHAAAAMIESCAMVLFNICARDRILQRYSHPIAARQLTPAARCWSRWNVREVQSHHLYHCTWSLSTREIDTNIHTSFHINVPNTSYTPCGQRLASLSTTCSDRRGEIGHSKWHFCQQTVESITWQETNSRKMERRETWAWAGRRGEKRWQEWDQTLWGPAPISHVRIWPLY